MQKAKIRASLGKLAKIKIPIHQNMSREDEQVLDLLVEASKAIDRAYLKQVYDKNLELLEQLKSKKDMLALDFFMWNKGPWDRMRGNEPVLCSEQRPKGAEYYPKDMTKEEFEAYVEKHKAEAAELKSYYTLVRRKADKLVAVKYSEAYEEELREASEKLDEAASATSNKSLKKFLKARAAAFKSNDYAKSDILWLRLDSTIEPTIGPYEVYDDMLLGYKAAFESYIGIKDIEKSKQLMLFTKYLKAIDLSMPISKAYKFKRKSQESPISVVNEVFAAGNANAGYTTSAFNLPNDDTIREAYGSKKILLKNIMDYKFEKIVARLADLVFEEEQKKKALLDASFNLVLFHELSHGMGPGMLLKPEGRISVGEALRDLYSQIEEAKADASGLYCALWLMNKGVIEKELEEEYIKAYYMMLIRSLRNDLQEAHAAGAAMSYNFLEERGAFKEKSEHIIIDFEKFKAAHASLLKQYLDIEAAGDYAHARKFVDKYLHRPAYSALISEESQKKKIPFDIFPVFE